MAKVSVVFVCPHCGRGRQRYREKKERLDHAKQKPLQLQCENCSGTFWVVKKSNGKFKCCVLKP